MFSTSFKDDSRCPRIQNVGCCSIQLYKNPPPSPPSAGQSYNSENVPLISFAEDQVLPAPEADFNAGFGFPLQLPSIEMQSPTGVQGSLLRGPISLREPIHHFLGPIFSARHTRDIIGLIVHCKRRSNDAIDQDSLALSLLQKLYISCISSEHKLVSVHWEEHVLAVQRWNLARRRCFAVYRLLCHMHSHE